MVEVWCADEVEAGLFGQLDQDVGDRFCTGCVVNRFGEVLLARDQGGEDERGHVITIRHLHHAAVRRHVRLI